MSLSLRDQLIAAGLAPKKGPKDQQRSKRPPQTPRNAAPVASPEALAAQRAQAEKFVRDQELNRKQQEKAQRKARAAQIRQIIDQHALPRVAGEDYYNFVDQGRVRRIAVTATLRTQLHNGEVLIARCSDRYDLVPAAAAERIRERDSNALMAAPGGKATAAAEPATDDPYKDFVVPDDLTW